MAVSRGDHGGELQRTGGSVDRRAPNKAVFVLAMMGIVTLVFLAILELLAANRGAEGSMPQIVGHPAPHLDVPLWNGAPGERLDVAALKGGPVVIAFWADGCDACHEEAPVIEAAARRYASTGVRFVGIAYDTNWQDGMRFVREYGITYPCGPDAGDTSARAYGILELPVTLFVNSRGVVVQRIDGEASTRMLDEAIAPLLQ